MKFIFTLILFVNTSLVLSQGLINQGARIVFSGGGQIVINGAAGNYSSTSNGLITPSSSSSITLGGNWINNSANVAFTTDGGAVVLNGANQTIGGTNPSAFYHLALSGSGTKQLAVNSTTVGGQSNFTGILSINALIFDLNSNRLEITNPAGTGIAAASGVIVSETNSAVNPSIVRWYMRTSTGVHDVPFGVTAGPTQIPLRFNITTAMASASDFVDLSTRATGAGDNLPWAGASNVAAVSFFNCPNVSLTGNPCAVNSVIDRWWDISPSSAVTANVRFSYRGVENTLNAPYNTGNIGAQWWDGAGWALDNQTSGSSAAVTAGVGNVTATGLTQFCPFVLSSVSAPLPIELVYMNVQCEQDHNIVSWTTASETNSKYFIIERSINGTSFEDIGKMNAAGYSSTKLDYSFIDKNTEKGTIYYYRLKEIDGNDLTKKYKTVSTQSCSNKDEEITIMNTPNGEVYISILSQQANSTTIRLFDLVGKLVKEETLEIHKGYNKFPLLINGLSPSMYLLNVHSGSKELNQKVIIGQN